MIKLLVKDLIFSNDQIINQYGVLLNDLERPYFLIDSQFLGAGTDAGVVKEKLYDLTHFLKSIDTKLTVYLLQNRT